jgi:hypothetical protein
MDRVSPGPRHVRLSVASGEIFTLALRAVLEARLAATKYRSQVHMRGRGTGLGLRG